MHLFLDILFTNVYCTGSVMVSMKREKVVSVVDVVSVPEQSAL